jgi:hypothetical protein
MMHVFVFFHRAWAHFKADLYYLKSRSKDPAEYIPALKLLQDLCSSSGELPSCCEFTNITLDRNVVGRGGEALIYGGHFNGRKVVVRETVIPRKNFWRSAEGQTIIKVTSNLCSRSSTVSYFITFSSSTV